MGIYRNHQKGLKVENINSKVSFIVPIFNVASYLEAALDSLIYQTYDNFEVIMVDDGSTDISGFIAKSFSATDSRFKYYRTENKGQSHARNIGLTKATGKFIAFFDPDDSLEKNFLEKLVLQMNENIMIVSYLFPSAKLGKCNRKITVDDFFSKMFSGTIGTVVWNKLFRKEILKNVKFPEGQVHEEINFYRQLLSVVHDYQILIINDNKEYNYRVDRPGNTTSTFDSKQIIGAKDAQKLVGDLRKSGKKKSIPVVQLNTLIFLKIYLQRSIDNDYKEDAKNMFNSLYLETDKLKCFLIDPFMTVSVVKFKLGLEK